MGHIEAKADGVRFGTYYGRTVYFPRCMFCAAEVYSYHYRREIDYTCEKCRPLKARLLSTGLFPKKKRGQDKT